MEAAYCVGLFACFWSGVVEAATALYGGLILRYVPQSALLSALAGISLAVLVVSTLYRLLTYPWVALLPLLLLLYTQVSNLPTRVCNGRIPIPWNALVVAIAVICAWVARFFGVFSFASQGQVMFGIFVPEFQFSKLWLGFSNGVSYISVFLPLAFLNGVGSLQVIAAAEKVNNHFAQWPALLCNGLVSIFSALLGNPFPTST